MGRPLYSRAFNTTPAVRDPEQPVCEVWSYLNAFDPDSDEFFDNENAVYEDFIDPVTPISPVELDDDDDDDDDEERDVLVVRMGNASPITSDSNLSDTDAPIARDGPISHAFRGIGQTPQRDADPAHVEPAVHVRLAARTPRRGFPTMAPRRVAPRPHLQRDDELPFPPPSAPIPVPTHSRRAAAADDRASLSPSTSPHQTPVAPVAMSPPPVATPRLYSWARNSGHSAAPSPSASSPFTNPHARTSYVHLSPVLVRIRDVTV